MTDKTKNLIKKTLIIIVWVIFSFVVTLGITTAIFGIEEVDGVEMTTTIGTVLTILIPVIGAVLIGWKVNFNKKTIQSDEDDRNVTKRDKIDHLRDEK